MQSTCTLCSHICNPTSTSLAPFSTMSLSSIEAIKAYKAGATRLIIQGMLFRNVVWKCVCVCMHMCVCVVRESVGASVHVYAVESPLMTHACMAWLGTSDATAGGLIHEVAKTLATYPHVEHLTLRVVMRLDGNANLQRMSWWRHTHPASPAGACVI